MLWKLKFPHSPQETSNDYTGGSANSSGIAPDLFAGHFESFEKLMAAETAPKAETLFFLDLAQIKPLKNQPRQHFDEESLQDLAESIKHYGILQPLIVTEDDVNPGDFKLVAGERRWRAARIAGLSHVPCVLKSSKNFSDLEIALIENIQREELSPVEEAHAYQRLLQSYNYTHDTLAQRLGKDRTTVSNSLRLLLLHPDILEDIQAKKLNAGHGRALCALDDKKLQLRARDVIISKMLSVRQAEALVKSLKNPKSQDRPESSEQLSPDLRHVCDQFKGHLGTKVKITGDTQRGKIEISYYSSEDLERVSDLVLGNPLGHGFK